MSNFRFSRGVSHPEELVLEAAKLGYAVIALTGECSPAGIVRAHLAAKEGEIRLIVGAELWLCDGPKLVLLATDRSSYGRLSALIARRRSAACGGDPKSHSHYADSRAIRCFGSYILLSRSTFVLDAT